MTGSLLRDRNDDRKIGNGRSVAFLAQMFDFSAKLSIPPSYFFSIAFTIKCQSIETKTHRCKDSFRVVVILPLLSSVDTPEAGTLILADPLHIANAALQSCNIITEQQHTV